jgi:hypothetical protein
MKWYANYTGVGEYMLLSEEQVDEWKREAKELDEDEGYQILETIKHMREFKTFGEAKKYLLDSFRCDMNDLQVGMHTLRRRRARE